MKSTILHHRPPGQNVPAKPPANLPERPRGIDPTRVPLAPGAPARAVAVLDALVAETAPLHPTALRKAFDPIAAMPPVPLRQVPLKPRHEAIDRDTVIAATNLITSYNTITGYRCDVLAEQILDALAEFATLLGLLTPDMAASILAGGEQL